MEKRAVLALSECLPVAPWDGGRVRFRAVLEALARRWKVRLVSFVDGNESSENIAELRTLCESVEVVPRPADLRRRIAGGLFSTLPLNVAAYSGSELGERARTAGAGADAVWVNRVRMWPYVPPGIRPVAMDFTDSLARFTDSLLEAPSFAHRWYGRIDHPRLARYETEVARTCDLAFCASPVDAEWLSTRSGRAVQTLPNAVSRADVGTVRQRACGVSVLFVGSMRYAPNAWACRWFCEWVWPRVRLAAPGATLTVAGSGRALYAPLMVGARVVVGQPDLRTLYREASVVVVPGFVRGGTRFKLLEAVANGVPVVTTTASAEGLPFRDGKDLLVRSDPDSFARAAIEASDARRGAALARSARAVLLRELTWERALPRALGSLEKAMRLASPKRFVVRARPLSLRPGVDLGNIGDALEHL